MKMKNISRDRGFWRCCYVPEDINNEEIPPSMDLTDMVNHIFIYARAYILLDRYPVKLILLNLNYGLIPMADKNRFMPSGSSVT